MLLSATSLLLRSGHCDNTQILKYIHVLYAIQIQNRTVSWKDVRVALRLVLIADAQGCVCDGSAFSPSRERETLLIPCDEDMIVTHAYIYARIYVYQHVDGCLDTLR
jgi:hypothetical protein